ncbi:reverse transcriptase domain-containing protein [Tanacetum coccineum]
MDDFSVFGNSFDNCLNNLNKTLQRCKDSNLVLNWEKCHCMVKEGILLEYKVSGGGLEVDKSKIDVISKLPPPTNVKCIRSFLRHAGFYRRFIIDFLKIARPLTKLLEKDTLFEFNDECHKAFKSLKEKLTCTSVIVSPNWNLLFKLMCDAIEFAVGAVLGTENVVADHLSWMDNDEASDDSDVDDNFPSKTLMEITTKDIPWFANFANYLVDLIVAGEKRMFQLHELDELRHQAYEKSHLYKARTKVWHDRKLKMRKEFKNENKVLLFHSKFKFKQPNLRSRCLGPYVVKRQYPSGYVELYGKDGKTFIVNGHRLKLYHEEENDRMEEITPFYHKDKTSEVRV